MPAPCPVDIQTESAHQDSARRLRIRVRGVVQGVGYRPFVYKLATEERVAGWVGNDSDGVILEVEGPAHRIARFMDRLNTEHPPLARVHAISSQAVALSHQVGFSIITSHVSGRASTGIPADAATCPDCLRELFDPADRRFGYAFLNCTNCGPRFTITRSLPYDRPQTSMAEFTMCPECRHEYDDPASRRFHAQPNACAACGPSLSVVHSSGRLSTSPLRSPLEETIHQLQLGRVIAIKGVGGFHLAVDATNEDAVRLLRQRKHRAAKPFAVMVKDIAAARERAMIDAAEEALLTGPERPIVLLRRRHSARLARSVAPDVPWLGIFLPYAPLHHLLFAGGALAALVMTSANLADEPICIDNDEAQERLSSIADGFLVHDREILQRCDDSVMAVVAGAPQIIRRARGYVPLPVSLPVSSPPLLAVGGQMKCAFTLARGFEAFQSQHLGDLDSPSSLEFFESALRHMQSAFAVAPEFIVHDLHPDYRSTQWAMQFAQAHRLPLIGVQHHHAHIAACMAEHGITDQVIGIALDGTGYGLYGTIWGGEVLVADLCDFRRVAHLRPLPMPGGTKAIEQPWRMALSALTTFLGEDAARSFGFPAKESALLMQRMRSGHAGPLTSSCGRLFDAVGALVLQRHSVDYEAQAAIEWEGVADSADHGSYSVVITLDTKALVIDPAIMLAELLEEMRASRAVAQISARFHKWLALSFAQAAQHIRSETAIQTICLSGGSMHNRLLVRLLRPELESMGFQVLLQSQVSPGDGGLSYGQAAVAAARIQRDIKTCKSTPVAASLLPSKCN